MRVIQPNRRSILTRSVALATGLEEKLSLGIEEAQLRDAGIEHDDSAIGETHRRTRIEELVIGVAFGDADLHPRLLRKFPGSCGLRGEYDGSVAEEHRAEDSCVAHG